jgi:hypothetical protein
VKLYSGGLVHVAGKSLTQEGAGADPSQRIGTRFWGRCVE